MLPIQTTPLIPDIEYFLDAALEHNELDAGSHVALKIYAPRASLIRIIDQEYEFGTIGLMRMRLSKCDQLIALADDLIFQLDAERRGAIAFAGLRAEHHEVNALAWAMATWAIEDEIKGGCMKPYKSRCTPNVFNYELSPKDRRRLYGPNWVRRYVKTNPDAQRARRRGQHVLRRLGNLTGVDLDAVQSAATAIAEDLRAQHEGYRRYNERICRRVFDTRSTSSKTELRRRRRVIKRAAACAEQIIGTKAVSEFAAGRSVIIEGTAISLDIARVGSAAQIGHSGLSVVAVDPQSRRKLADMCIYVEKTPALDQLSALALAMRAGEESEIISTANLSNVTELGFQNSLIAERGKDKAARQWRPRDDRQEKNEAYWLETRPMWTESLGVFALGRAWNPSMLPAAEARHG